MCNKKAETEKALLDITISDNPPDEESHAVSTNCSVRPAMDPIYPQLGLILAGKFPI